MSNTIKTSETHPIRVDSVRPKDGYGRIGVTLCPGKKYPWGLAGNWERDLDPDLDRISRWGATAVVSLITWEEIRDLEVQNLSRAVADRHMEWWHLPIRTGSRPDRNSKKPGYMRERPSGTACGSASTCSFTAKAAWAVRGPSPRVCSWSSANVRTMR